MPQKKGKAVSQSYVCSCYYLGGVLSHLEKISQRWGIQTSRARKEIEDVRRRMDQAYNKARNHV